MQVEQLSLLDFFLLSEDKRIEYKTIYDNVTFEVDCKKWLYKEVKETQYLLRNELTYKNIIDIVGIKIKGDLMAVDAHIVFGTFNGILKSIVEISEIESNALGSTLNANEMIALEEVGGFEVFGYLPELDRLAGGNILQYEKIKNLSWEDCFSKLAMDSRQNKFNKKIAELIKNQND